jgi:CelD/BcsL family acetyltransferase involved in cellulose biosynthesis
LLATGPAEQTLTVLGVWRPHVDEIVLGADRATLEACASVADARFLATDRDWLERRCVCDWIALGDSTELPSAALLESLRRLPRSSHPVRISDGASRTLLVRNLPWTDETGKEWVFDGSAHPALSAGMAAMRPVTSSAPIVSSGYGSPELAYESSVRPLEQLAALASGEQRLLELEIHNGCDWPWPAGSVRPGFRWLHPSGYDHGLEGTGEAFDAVVRPGASARVLLPVPAPLESGPYLLELDLFHEGRRWFGCPTRIDLSVERVSRMASPTGGGGLAFEPVGSFDEIAEELDGLAEKAGNLFATSEWLSAWWRHYGRGELALSAARSGSGELLAVLPLYVSGRRPLRTLRFIGHGVGDQCGPVCAPDQSPAAARALAEQLAQNEFDLFVGHDLPVGDHWPGHVAYTTASPLLRLAGLDWEGYLASRQRRFRHAVRSFGQRLEDAYRVSFRQASGPTDVPRAMEELCALHEARWDGRSRALSGPNQELHVDFAQRAAARGWLRLTVMELDGAPAAAAYNFRFAGAEYEYQCGRDPAHDHEWVGMLLRCHSIRQAIEDGMREYRFLRGDEAYKYRLADDDPGVVTIGLARNPAARAALGLASRAPTMPWPVRRRLPPLVSPWPAARAAA